ncbi:hypothetical protein K491DRAFT_215074 [Lophiostoma macrostomum CBS 122681]|uniref:Uncharacterized protein n=1 Tax=Lophiostoma macrostomum CBS 122681 TaxID=1314788 RepID=A0A6A6SNC0_9PLEO|nr:hypothetical protein K491DRAFT_215074 [Lophiostoma macrostomum CBS 122681]
MRCEEHLSNELPLLLLLSGFASLVSSTILLHRVPTGFTQPRSHHLHDFLISIFRKSQINDFKAHTPSNHSPYFDPPPPCSRPLHRLDQRRQLSQSDSHCSTPPAKLPSPTSSHRLFRTCSSPTCPHSATPRRTAVEEKSPDASKAVATTRAPHCRSGQWATSEIRMISGCI